MRKRIFYGCIVVIIIILIVYFVILLKRGIILTKENPIIQELYQKSHPSQEASVLKELYQEDGFTNKYILAVGMKEYLKQNKKETISEEEIEQTIQSLFKDISFSHESFYLMADNICGFHYDKEKHVYESLSNCEEDKKESYEQEIISLNKLGNKIFIREKVLFLIKEEDISIYTSSNKKELLGKVKQENYHKEDYMDKAMTYEFVFTLMNGNYVLTDIHRIKE